MSAKTKIDKYEITCQPQDLNSVWRDSDNSDYELNNPLKYFLNGRQIKRM